MVDLTGQTVLVAGGAGEVGEGITRQFLNAGATVVVPSRRAEKLQKLSEWVGYSGERLVTIEGEIGTPSGAAEIRDAAGQVDHVVASLGGWWQGTPLTQIDLHLWHRLLDNSLTAHFIAAKTFLPVLSDGASYTLINGGAALHAMPMVAPVAVSATAQLKLGEVMAVENQHLRINSLVLATPIRTRSRPDGEPGWLSNNDAGKYCVYLASDASEQTGATIIFKSVDEIPM